MKLFCFVRECAQFRKRWLSWLWRSLPVRKLSRNCGVQNWGTHFPQFHLTTCLGVPNGAFEQFWLARRWSPSAPMSCFLNFPLHDPRIEIIGRKGLSFSWKPLFYGVSVILVFTSVWFVVPRQFSKFWNLVQAHSWRRGQGKPRNPAIWKRGTLFSVSPSARNVSPALQSRSLHSTPPFRIFWLISSKTQYSGRSMAPRGRRITSCKGITGRWRSRAPSLFSPWKVTFLWVFRSPDPKFLYDFPLLKFCFMNPCLRSDEGL